MARRIRQHTTPLRVYSALFVQMLKVRLAYRGDFIADMIATGLGGVANLLFVILVFRRIPDLAGWEQAEVLFVYGMSMISYGLFACISWNLYDFGDRYIIQGEFDRVLLRPASSFLQVMFDSFRIPALSESLIGATVVAYAVVTLGLPVTFSGIGLALIGVVSGFVIFTAVFTIIASLSFHFEDRVGVAPPIFNMIAFGRYPQNIFPSALKFILRWMIPFGFVAYYPATGILAKDASRLAYLSPLVALGFALIAGVFWRFGVRRYESTGF